MRCILFIDDQPNVLRGLERMLRAFRHQADCLFVRDPEEAIAVARKVQPDIVVTDMRMPGVDGLDVLDDVRLHCPSSARVLLSGDIGLDNLGRTAGVAHQCLNKPCSSDELTAKLSTLLRLRQRVIYPRLRAGLYRMSALPVNPELPAMVQQALAHGDDTRYDSMLRVLWQGPALAGKLLQISTWAGVGTGQHGEDLKAATELWAPAVLGVLFEALHPVQADDATPFMHDVWSQIRVSAHLAEVVASEEQMPRHEMNLTAIAAILSQAGALVLESICHEEYLGLRLEAGRHAVPIEVMERAYFGLSAHEVVAWLGRLWGLPSIVADLLDQCASPFVWDAESLTPAAAVRLAQALSQARGDGHLAGDVKEFLRRRGRLDRVYGWTRAAASVPDPAAA